jgi:hypoxanthine phosphoribosyltransferase
LSVTPLLTETQLREGVQRTAAAIADTYAGAPVTIVGVLTGSLVFVADLIRHLEMPLRIAFVQARSYHGPAKQPGVLRIDASRLPQLRGQHVLLVDDIFDTGRTMEALVRELTRHEPQSLRSAVLLRKAGRQEVPLVPDFVAFDIPDAFVVGYGLDFNDLYRNLPFIAVLSDAAEVASG